jgi:hypothetical protein
VFTRPTAVILGAGASWHYGYPTGEELVEEMMKQAANITSYYNQNTDTGMTRGYYESARPRFCRDKTSFQAFSNQLKELCAAIKAANPLVIDYFLGHNEPLKEIGRLLIAFVILKHERKGNLPPKAKVTNGSRHEDDWVRFVASELTSGCTQPTDLAKNDVTFVSFNYDLSFEQRLHQALSQYSYFCQSDAIRAFFQQNKIMHVYGKIRTFDPNVPYPDNSTDQLGDILDDAYEAAGSLRTIAPHEKEASPEIVEAIDRAEYVYMLGYGFDKTNNQLLKLGDRSDAATDAQHIRYTNYGNRNQINNRVAKLFNVSPNELSASNFSANNFAFTNYANKRFRCEKSTKSVYCALAEDFDWPE